MREIKFRAWDKKNKKYFRECNYLYFGIGGIRFMWVDPKRDEMMATDLPTEDYELLQFTGLKDKNGIEIYEGDIVRIWEYGFKDGNEDGGFDLYQDMGTDKVTMDRFPIYWLDNEEFGYEGEDLINPEHCEVIGNIMENPKLLEK